jgi:hypothetical protein
MQKTTWSGREDSPTGVAGAVSEETSGPSTDPQAPNMEPAEGQNEVEIPAPESLIPPPEPAPEGLAGVIVGTLAAVAGRIARAMSHEPLANLYELHPEARESSPRELGFRFVGLDEIRGTAVAGIAQRGEDFTPLPPFRGENWQSRWQRIRNANAQLKPLPPIDLIKFDGGYWVVDGHNRVAAALADHAVGLDAMVTELVPLDGHSSELATAMLEHLGDVMELRAAASGLRPAMGVRTGGAPSTVETEMPEPEYLDQSEVEAPHESGSAA